MKKVYLALLAIAVVSFMSMGCMTSMVINQQPSQIEKKSSDSIVAFLISKDQSKIIFISEKYNYIYMMRIQNYFL